MIARVIIVIGAMAGAAYLDGCFNPKYSEGLTCSTDHTCPPGQACYPDNRCRATSGGMVDARRVDGPRIDGPPAACTLSPQTGCQDGAKCTVSSTMSSTSCALAGNIAIGAACTGFGTTDNCVAGGVCEFGLCSAFCAATPDCGSAASCIMFGNGGNGSAASTFNACDKSCDPLSPMCPGSGSAAQNCYVTNDSGGNGVGACAPNDGANAGIGSPCVSTNDCVGGTDCVGSAGSTFCRAYCNFTMYPNQQGTCASGQTCMELLGATGACL